MWSIIQAAGWPIWPLIFASVIALALIFERLWSLRQSVVAPSGMVDKVLAEYKRTGLTPERAADMLLTVCARANYDSLVTARGWSPAEYRDWLSDTLAASLLPAS